MNRSAPPVPTSDPIDACTREALRLLEANLTPQGILAARRTEAAEARRYTRMAQFSLRIDDLPPQSGTDEVLRAQ